MTKASDNPFPSTLFVEGTVPTTPAAGDQRVYIDSADHKLKRVNSSGSVTVVEGGSSAMAQIADTTLGVATASITFSSIPGTYNHLLLEIDARGDTAATFTNLNVIVNSDTAANYDHEGVFGNGSSAGGLEGIAESAGYLGGIVAASAPTGVSSPATVRFPNYAGTTFHKSFVSQSGQRRANSTGNLLAVLVYGSWRSTSAITSIKIQPAAGNFAAGTRATLYGMT